MPAQLSGHILFAPPPPPQTHVPYFCIMIYHVMSRALRLGEYNVLGGTNGKDLNFLTDKRRILEHSVLRTVSREPPCLPIQKRSQISFHTSNEDLNLGYICTSQGQEIIAKCTAHNIVGRLCAFRKERLNL